MTDTVNAFILAAGLGERLRPITDILPKPLLPVYGRPVLERVLEHVSSVRLAGIGMNIHYKAEMIRDWCKASPYASQLSFFLEESILGTGGGLRNAAGFLGRRTFLVHNADIVHDFDLSALLDFHGRSGNVGTLAVIDHPPINNVHVGPGELLAGVGDMHGSGRSATISRTFTGIAVYEHEFLEYIPDGVSSVVDAWFNAIRAGNRIGCYTVQGHYWSDIGSPDAYAVTVMRLLNENGEKVFIHPSVDTCDRIEMGAQTVIEQGVHFKGSAEVHDCLILPGTVIEGGAVLDHCIAGKGFVLDIPEQAFVVGDTASGLRTIGAGGSDRNYYRVTDHGGTTVLLRSGEDDEDFVRHIEYSRFFRKEGFPVPGLIDVDMEDRKAVFEDLGDMTLYDRLRCRRSGKEIFSLYERALRSLLHLHIDVTKKAAECPLLAGRIFDRDYFRWETQYFLERFLRDLRKIDRTADEPLVEELDRLADTADSLGKTVMHRDCQSQNIMITKDGDLRFIDYQGARMGPPEYDLASLLWDPYAPLPDDIRNDLLDIYLEGTPGQSRKAFERSLSICRIQRHMQALGAYSFLSLVKEKHYFQKFIPEGIRLLKEDCALVSGEFPRLTGVVTAL